MSAHSKSNDRTPISEHLNPSNSLQQNHIQLTPSHIPSHILAKSSTNHASPFNPLANLLPAHLLPQKLRLNTQAEHTDNTHNRNNTNNTIRDTSNRDHSQRDIKSSNEKVRDNTPKCANREPVYIKNKVKYVADKEKLGDVRTDESVQGRRSLLENCVGRNGLARDETSMFCQSKPTLETNFGSMKIQSPGEIRNDSQKHELNVEYQRNIEVDEQANRNRNNARRDSKYNGVGDAGFERRNKQVNHTEQGSTRVVNHVPMSTVDSRCTAADATRDRRTIPGTEYKSSHITEPDRMDHLTNSISANTANCCTLPQLPHSQRPTVDTPSVGGASRSMRTACVQRYLPRAAHPIALSPPTPATPAQRAPGCVTNANSVSQGNVSIKSDQKKKRANRKKCIFISYSPDSSYAERRLVSDVVKQLKLNNLDGDIWFDVDEGIVGEPCWLAARLEAAEMCHAALLFLSHAYFSSSTCVYEARTIMTRLNKQATQVGDNSLGGDDHVTTYCVLYDLNNGVPDVYRRLTVASRLAGKSKETAAHVQHDNIASSLTVASGSKLALANVDEDNIAAQLELVDLCCSEMRDRSHDELANYVIASFSNCLERHASVHVCPQYYVPPVHTNRFPNYPIRIWTTDDVQG